MSWFGENFDAPSGAELNLYRLVPANPKAIVHVNHGMAEHAGRYGRFAESLAEAGYGTYAQDHRGHGHTRADGTSLGIFAPKSGWDQVLSDVAAVNVMITEKHPDVPVVCFGHSMGSIIAFNHILRAPLMVSGAALWNAGVETGALVTLYGAILRFERFFKGSDVPSGIAARLSFDAWNKVFAPNRTNFDWLSRDTVEVDKYVEDPLCGFDVSIGMWLDVLEGIRFAASDEHLSRLPADLPIHLQAGEEDPCSENGRAVASIEKRMKARGMESVSFNLLKDTRHESLNEKNRDQTTSDFITWLDNNIAR